MTVHHCKSLCILHVKEMLTHTADSLSGKIGKTYIATEKTMGDVCLES